MEISAAQRDVRTAYFGGFAGQLVSSAVWFASAAAATWISARAGILVLAVVGTMIFPFTRLLLRVMGRPVTLPKTHPMNALAMQVTFTLPLTFPLIYAATVHHLYWFFPAFSIAVGAHYLPFMFLYGMPLFGALAAVLVGSGVLIGMYLHAPFSVSGWFTAATLLLFAFLGRQVALRESRKPY